MQLPVTLSLRPSRRLVLLLIAAHGGALLSLASLGLELWFKVIPAVIVVASLGYQLTRQFGARRIVRLGLHRDGALECTRRNGEAVTLAVHPQSTVTPLLSVLLLCGGQGRRSKVLETLTLLPDALDSEDFRRLRLWLRWLAVREHTR